MGRKILPMEITEQASSVISSMNDNREILFSVMPDINAFCNLESLQGETWSKAKAHMENHIIVIQGLISTIDYFKRVCTNLVSKCGTEDLDEDVLLEQKGILSKELNYYITQLNILDTCSSIDERDIRYSISELYYESTFAKKSYYGSMITNLETQIYYIDEKINKIDEIDIATQKLTDNVEVFQTLVNEGIGYLTASLSETGFTFPLGYEVGWKDKITDLWSCLDQINDYEQETLFDDQKKIEVSKTNNKMYFTFDRSGIIYNGEIYEIFVPPQDGKDYIDLRYTTVEEKEKYKLDFDYSKLLYGIELEDPDFKSVNTSAQTVYDPRMTNSLAAGIVLDGLIGGVEAGLEKVDIKVMLQEATDGEEKRAIILMGSYDNRMLEDKLNYGVEMSMQQAYIGNSIAQDAVSISAFNLYNSTNGGHETQNDDIYDYVAVFSEDREKNYYHAYLSFDTNGNMIVTPFRYEEEKISIVKYDNDFHINGEEVMDVTDIMLGSYVYYSEDCSEVIAAIVSDSVY